MQNLKIIMICFHCLLLFLINFFGTSATIMQVFFSYDEAREKQPKVVEFVQVALQHPVIWSYSTYSGINAIYNFYAPEVGSEFSLYFQLVDANNKIISTKSIPDLAQNESKLRFSLCTSIMQEKLKRYKEKELDEFIRVMFKQISLFVLNSDLRASKIRTIIYVNDYPPLRKFRNNNKVKTIMLKKYEFDSR